jgi:hypothetical protein
MTLSGLIELFTSAIKNVNITINVNELGNNLATQTEDIPKGDNASCSNVKDDTLNKPSCSNVKDDIKSREIQEVPKDPKNKTDELVKEDFLSLVNDMENMSATLKKINRNLAGRNNTEVFAMLEKFDRFLHSIKVIIHVI